MSHHDEARDTLLSKSDSAREESSRVSENGNPPEDSNVETRPQSSDEHYEEQMQLMRQSTTDRFEKHPDPFLRTPEMDAENPTAVKIHKTAMEIGGKKMAESFDKFKPEHPDFVVEKEKMDFAPFLEPPTEYDDKYLECERIETESEKRATARFLADMSIDTLHEKTKHRRAPEASNAFMSLDLLELDDDEEQDRKTVVIKEATFWEPSPLRTMIESQRTVIIKEAVENKRTVQFKGAVESSMTVVIKEAVEIPKAAVKKAEDEDEEPDRFVPRPARRLLSVNEFSREQEAKMHPSVRNTRAKGLVSKGREKFDKKNNNKGLQF